MFKIKNVRLFEFLNLKQEPNDRKILQKHDWGFKFLGFLINVI